MTRYWIEVQDDAVLAALERMQEHGENLQPFLQGLGDDLVERTKRRFETSTGPDGVPWKANAAATLAMLSDRLGKSYRKKDGSLNAKGDARMAAKKPLIGESGDLRRQIVAVASAAEVAITVAPVYAAIQQFGGQAGRGLKVTIPARPYLPVRPDGSLYPAESAAILESVNDYLRDGLMD